MRAAVGLILLACAVVRALATTPPLLCGHAQCCHPTSCSRTPPDCSAVSCTAVCMPGTMDCGGGRCEETANGTCVAVWANGSTTPATPTPTPPTTTAAANNGTCTGASDCVAAQCCHPTSCVRRADAPDCTAALCPANCEPGTMDCGGGVCRCGADGCYVQWANATTTAAPPPPATCAAANDCIPAQCCHATSCTSIRNPPDCSGVVCSNECVAGTMDCGHGTCACDIATGTCHVQWSSIQPSTRPPSATPAPAVNGECTLDSDCRPNDCCEPTECVPAMRAPDCSAVSCPAVCRPHTMSCGHGRCVCSAQGRCGVAWNATQPQSTLRGAGAGRSVFIVSMVMLVATAFVAV